MYVVYVLDRQGKPLMPTKRFGHVRRMLKTGKAKAISTKPFVIQLQYESTDFVQPLYGGTDPGRTNIGEAVLNNKGEVVYAAHVTTRNKEIPKLMADRAAHRRASRRGERLRRKRRAKANGTMTCFSEGRKLPGYKDGVLKLKGIINTESRFNNRKRPAGWLTPTARQCIQTHLNMVQNICKILPVTDWTLEYNRFAFMQLEDGSVCGWDFQNGRLKGYASKEDYIYALQGGACICCSSSIEHYHHIKPRHKGGSNTPENLVGLCSVCHAEIHTGKRNLDKIGKYKKYAGTSIVNVAIPFIWDGIAKMFGDKAHICEGQETAELRRANSIPKEHFADAVCIAGIGSGITPQYDDNQPFELRQFRCHNRSHINAQMERTYMDGKTVVAKNRKPRFEQKGDALSDLQSKITKEHGELAARRAVSKLVAKKSYRRYNAPERIKPSAIFMFNNKRYLLSGQLTNGRYYRAFGEGPKNFPSRNCEVVSFGYSLTYA